MPRKRPPVNEPANRRSTAAAFAGAWAAPLPLGALCLLGFLVLLALRLYYGDAPDLHYKQRMASLVFLLAPDELFTMWCGGKLANFSLLDRWPIVLLTAVILGGAWLAGRLALWGLGLLPVLDRLERVVFALGVGLNLFSLYAQLVGLAGALQNRWVFVFALLLLVAGSLTLAMRQQPVPSQPTSRDDPRWLWWLVAALPFVSIIFLGAMLPPWAYDVREYHLQTPKEWFQNGRIDFLPHNIYANMPLGSELNAVWAMALYGGKDGWWWGAMAGKTIMACYSLAAAAALVALGRRVHSLAAGIIAAVIYLSIPWTTSIAVTGYNEGPVALYAVLAIYSLWLAQQADQQPTAWRLVALGGFCAGSAVACKYPPMLFLVMPLSLWILLARQNGDQTSRLIRLGVYSAAVAVACGPWFFKNLALTDNPTYPLLYSVFDGKTRTPEKHAQWQKVHSPQPDDQGRRFSAHSFTSEIAWNGWRSLWASLALPPLIAVSFLARAQRRFLAVLALWAGFVFVSWWLFTHRLDRFLVLLMPLASLAAALGVFAVPHPAWRVATLAFVGITAAVHFPLVALHPDNRYFAPLARLRSDDRDLGEAGVRVEAAHRWLNQHASDGERVLLVGDAEPFDLELPAIYNTCFDDCQFTRIFKDRSREERLALLRDEQIKYVFFSWAHLARYRSPGNYGYTSDYPTPQLVHQELVNEQRLLVPIALDSEPAAGELFQVAAD